MNGLDRISLQAVVDRDEQLAQALASLRLSSEAGELCKILMLSKLPRCPFCNGTNLRGPFKKFTTPGILCALFGLVLAPVGIGLILIFIGFKMREMKYRCQCVARWF